MAMSVIQWLKDVFGACPSCHRFGQKTVHGEPRKETIRESGETIEFEFTPHSIVCAHCGHTFEEHNRPYIHTEYETEESHGGAGWGWRRIKIIYADDKGVGSVAEEWQHGDNR